MENGNLFSCEANGYAIAEVDEYLKILYKEYSSTVAWGKELEQRYFNADKVKKDLQEEFLAVKKSKDELYENCVKLSNALNSGAASAVKPSVGFLGGSVGNEVSQDIISSAKAEAARIVSDAERKSEELISRAQGEVDKLRAEAAQKAEQLAQIIGALGKFGI